MTGMMSVIPTAPPEPETQILVDGDQCDSRGCPARAYVRVRMYVDGDKETLAGTLHFCAHHWKPLLDTFWLLSAAGKCSYLDETDWITR